MTHSLFDLSGRVGLVTGAAQGMGRATAIGFAEAGADVLITDINATGVRATADHIQTLGGARWRLRATSLTLLSFVVFMRS